MKDKNGLIIKLLKIVTLVILYYIVGVKSLFLYTISISLYNIFTAAFKHISISNTLLRIKDKSNRIKLFKYLLLTILVISIMFLLLGIIVSDIINIVLDINDILIVYIFMGLTIITEPLIRLLSEFLIVTRDNHKFGKIIDLYYILDNILLIVIGLFVFRIFKLSLNIAISLLYLSKILSCIIIVILMYIVNKNKKDKQLSLKENVNYKKEIKEIISKNSYQSIIKIVKNSFSYLSIIILYLILSGSYNYKIDVVERDITFIYLYGLVIVDFVIYIAKIMNDELPKELTLTSRIYNNFKIMLSLAIVFSIVSPLTCKVIFNNSNYAIYLVMLNIMTIFSLIYDITYDNISNKKIIYISLFLGLIVKIATEIPLINAFYRMGYNLIYGDILASILGMILSIVINYIYIRNKEKTKDNYFTKLLDIFYENIILCIVLIIIQFIIPIKTDNYFKALGLLIIYLGISIVIFRLKNKKRG